MPSPSPAKGDRGGSQDVLCVTDSRQTWRSSSQGDFIMLDRLYDPIHGGIEYAI